MGIGAALATGLVQGFTQNINNEKARRQGERDKVDKYQQILMNASLNPGKDFSASNAKLLGSMIQNANKQLDDQERINLFGQQGEDLDIDFSGVLSQLQGGSSGYESTLAGFGFDVDIKKFGKDDSFSALTSMANVFNTAEGRAKLTAASDDELKALHRVVSSHKHFLSNEYETAKLAGQDYEIPLDKQFKMFDPFNEIYTKRITNGVSTNDASGSDPQDDNTGAIVFNLDNKFLVDFGDAEIGQAVREIADNFGYKNAQNFAKFWDDYTGITGFTFADKQQVLDGAAQLAKEYRENNTELNLDSQTPNFNLMDKNDATEVLFRVNQLSGGNKTVAALILGAFAPIANFNPTKQNARFIDTQISGKLYSAQILFGSSATEKDFNKLVEQQNNFDVVLGKEGEGGSGLRGLQWQLNNMDGPAAINGLFGMIASARATFQSLVNVNDEEKWAGGANTGTILVSDFRVDSLVSDDLAEQNKNKINPDTGRPYKYMTESFVSELDFSVAAAYERGRQGKDGSVERAIKYAKFEATRIALAFQMARAADPSGRLSNQDIEAQLIRLGKDWDAPEVAAARLDTTINDFEILQKRYAQIVEVGNTSGNLNVGQKKQIKGNYTLVRLGEMADINTSGSAFNKMQTGEATLVPFDPDTMFFDPRNGKVYSLDNFVTPLTDVDPNTIPKKEQGA